MARRLVSWLPSVLLPLVAAAAFWRNALSTGADSGFGDWQFFHHMWEVARIGLLRDGELPLWNPHHCGGLTYFGNPQSQAFSPFFPLALVVGTVFASKLFLVAHTALALVGAYRLAIQRMAVRPAAAVLGASVWAFSGFFAWHGGGGHASFLPFAFTPWVLHALSRAYERPRVAVEVAVWMSLCLLEGGVYPTLFITVFVAFDAISVLALRRVPARNVGLALSIAGGLALAASAVRVLPIVVEIFRSPRPVEGTDKLGLLDLLKALTARGHTWRVPDHPYVWPEYGAYIGWGALILAGAGISVAWRKKVFVRLAALLLFTLLAMGDRAAFWPWPILRSLPVYDSLRVPSRFLVFVTLELGLLVALGFDTFIRSSMESPHALFRRVGTAVMLCLAVAVPIDLVGQNGTTADLFHQPPLGPVERADAFHLVGPSGYGRSYARYPAQNVGTAACYEGLVVRPPRTLWTGEVPQVRVDPADAGTVRESGRTQNAVAVTTRLDRPARLVFNQRYDADWTATAGKVVSADGLLAVDAPAGRRSLRVEYRPMTLYPGIVLSLVGWGGIAWILVRGRRQGATAAAGKRTVGL